MITWLEASQKRYNIFRTHLWCLYYTITLEIATVILNRCVSWFKITITYIAHLQQSCRLPPSAHCVTGLSSSECVYPGKPWQLWQGIHTVIPSCTCRASLFSKLLCTWYEKRTLWERANDTNNILSFHKYTNNVIYQNYWLHVVKNVFLRTNIDINNVIPIYIVYMVSIVLRTIVCVAAIGYVLRTNILQWRNIHRTIMCVTPVTNVLRTIICVTAVAYLLRKRHQSRETLFGYCVYQENLELRIHFTLYI